MEQQLSEIYYKPENLWKGKKAINKLKLASGVKPKKVKEFLYKQAFWQVHYPSPKEIKRPHYDVEKPNKVHQFDLLYMPGDKLYGNKYKYILTGIDVASRFKVARPMRTKKASDVAEMLKDIYKKGPLKFPKTFVCDNGSEFKSDVTKMLETNNVVIKRTTTKYKHTHTAFVESFNKVLSERLFKIQDAQELNDPDKVSTTWVKHLYNIVNKLNSTKTEMTGMNPKDAIKKEKVDLIQREEFPPEDKIPEIGLYRYLLQPGEEHNDQRKRATDRIWSKKKYRIEKVIQDPGNRIIYFLNNGPERSFVSEELMRIPEDTKLPPDFVQNW